VAYHALRGVRESAPMIYLVYYVNRSGERQSANFATDADRNAAIVELVQAGARDIELSEFVPGFCLPLNVRKWRASARRGG
jgi:hypothetical protein